MNGKHGDHPITDIVGHKLSVYGEPLDNYIRQIAQLMSPPRMHDWFNPLWASLSTVELERTAKQKLDELRRDAQARGWESPT